jgi:hypothetical protein
VIARVLGYFGLVGLFAAGIQVGVGDRLHSAFWDTTTSTHVVTLPGKSTPRETVTAAGKTVTTPVRVVRRVLGKTRALPRRVLVRKVTVRDGTPTAPSETRAAAGATRTVTVRGATRTVAAPVRTVTVMTTQTVTVTCAPPPHPTNPPCPPHK